MKDTSGIQQDSYILHCFQECFRYLEAIKFKVVRGTALEKWLRNHMLVVQLPQQKNKLKH